MFTGVNTPTLEEDRAIPTPKSVKNSQRSLSTHNEHVPIEFDDGDEDDDARMAALLKAGDPTTQVAVLAKSEEKTKAQVKAKPLVASPYAYWQGKQMPVRRSVKALRAQGEGFCGHDRILELIQRAKHLGDEQEHRDGIETGDLDAATTAFYFLAGCRSREGIYSVYKPLGAKKPKSIFQDKEGNDVYFGVRKADIVYEKSKKAYVVTLRVIKKRVRTLIGTDPDTHKKVYKSERDVTQLRVFPILEEERELPYLLDYMDKLDPNDWLFPISYSKLYRMTNQISDGEFFPHRFRFERASSLVRDYGYDTLKLLSFFRWVNVKEAALYAGQNVDDLIAGMRGE